LSPYLYLYAVVDYIIDERSAVDCSVTVRLSVKKKPGNSKKDRRRKWLRKWNGLEWNDIGTQR